VIEESFRGTLAAMGFEEQLMRLKPEPDVEEAPGQFWKDFIHDTAPEFRKSTFEQIETLIQPIWSELISGSIYATGRLTQIFGEVRPDVIVQDNVVAFAPVVTAGTPWVRIVSCNPLEVSDPALPPALSGLPAGDRSGWERFRDAYRDAHAGLHHDFDTFLRDHGAPALPGQPTTTISRVLPGGHGACLVVLAIARLTDRQPGVAGIAPETDGRDRRRGAVSE